MEYLKALNLDYPNILQSKLIKSNQKLEDKQEKIKITDLKENPFTIWFGNAKHYDKELSLSPHYNLDQSESKGTYGKIYNFKHNINIINNDNNNHNHNSTNQSKQNSNQNQLLLRFFQNFGKGFVAKETYFDSVFYLSHSFLIELQISSLFDHPSLIPNFGFQIKNTRISFKNEKIGYLFLPKYQCDLSHVIFSLSSKNARYKMDNEDEMFQNVETSFCKQEEEFLILILKKWFPNLFYLLIDALMALHEQNICHYDIKPANILLNFSSPLLNIEEIINSIDLNKDFSLQIPNLESLCYCDYGFGHFLPQVYQIANSAPYRPPELGTDDHSSQKVFYPESFLNRKVDVYALGTTIQDLVCPEWGWLKYESRIHIQKLTIKRLESILPGFSSIWIKMTEPNQIHRIDSFDLWNEWTKLCASNDYNHNSNMIVDTNILNPNKNLLVDFEDPFPLQKPQHYYNQQQYQQQLHQSQQNQNIVWKKFEKRTSYQCIPLYRTLTMSLSMIPKEKPWSDVLDPKSSKFKETVLKFKDKLNMIYAMYPTFDVFMQKVSNICDILIQKSILGKKSVDKILDHIQNYKFISKKDLRTLILLYEQIDSYDAKQFKKLVRDYIVPINQKTQNEILALTLDILLQFYHQADSSNRNKHKVSTLLITCFYVAIKMIDSNHDTLEFVYENVFKKSPANGSLEHFTKKIYIVETLVVSSLCFPIQRNLMWNLSEFVPEVCEYEMEYDE